ncbi:MAG: radical SAM protein [Anaerolineae bacterium]
MELSGLHLLLTYQCNFECDHCFVWGSPWQSGTMKLEDIREILRQAEALGTVEWVYFEGGEPFLYYPILSRGVQEAADRGFHVGIVTNSYWATAVEDALAWLEPLSGLIEDFSVSSDLYHYDEALSRQVEDACVAARRLSIPIGVISVAQPKEDGSETTLTYRGRAVEKLASQATLRPWEIFDECPYENLRQPGRVHVDPLGHIHVCQGISLGNLFRSPLTEICEVYDPEAHPVTGPLLAGGPAELARRYGATPHGRYADACHLCYETRLALRQRFPQILAPDQVYGVCED